MSIYLENWLRAPDALMLELAKEYGEGSALWRRSMTEKENVYTIMVCVPNL